MKTEFLSRLMKMSWSIQRNKHCSRAKSLRSAWAIISNEDITVQFLAVKLNHHRPVKKQALEQIALFV